MNVPTPGTPPVSTDAGQALAIGIAGLSHDLRAALTAIYTATELLDQDLDQLGPTDIRQMARTIHRGTRRLEQLTDNLHSLLALRGDRLAVTLAPLICGRSWTSARTAPGRCSPRRPNHGWSTRPCPCPWFLPIGSSSTACV